MLPSEIPRLATDSLVRVFPGVWKLLSFFKTPFPGWIFIPTSFASLFIFYILSYLLLKTMGYLSGWLMSSASIQKLFCEICSAFKCPFDEFVGEKVISPSYSSAILGLPPFTPFSFISALILIIYFHLLFLAFCCCCCCSFTSLFRCRVRFSVLQFSCISK